MNIQQVVEDVEMSLRRRSMSMLKITVVRLSLAQKEQASRMLLLITQQV